ncbi:Hypothetical transcriptional regulator [Mycobacteroides abscessus subsp. bolletii]|uniref:helix-turn-helix domain-containing protein n=1 Tax=Mycobacteroides abscessus TaxID=36809 RepID=UPI00092804BB|nr:XRE family transcriptional regulator [Mycobacteroides abscessus]SIA14153.1 Hypothetical transcriptional regulator [Mycobacteroides abscessus subsp. bolletii]SIA69173.1 Hypothetical transcriptional regulator [Mycobacteroides abscessus subsp. bolletii]
MDNDQSAPAEVGARLRRLRTEAGLSLAELATRSGVGKGSISELENGRRTARLDTLFALTKALGAPLSAAVGVSPPTDGPSVHGQAVHAVSLGGWQTDDGYVEVYRITVDTTTQHSPAHATGVRETITVVAGTLEAGPLGDPQIAAAGETMCFPGNVAHIYGAVNRPAEAVLTMHYPPGIKTPVAE